MAKKIAKNSKTTFLDAGNGLSTKKQCPKVVPDFFINFGTMKIDFWITKFAFWTKRMPETDSACLSGARGVSGTV